MPNVLILSHPFPPVGGGGTARVHAFVKYLPRYSWRPIVCTVETQYHPDFLMDDTLEKEYEAQTLIVRTKSFEPQGAMVKSLQNNIYGVQKTRSSFFDRYLKPFLRQIYHAFAIPDGQLLWLPQAIQTGRKLIKSRNIEVIFATVPPHSVGVIAALLSRLTNKPLILDFRDDWVGESRFDTGSFHKRWLSKVGEKWLVKTAKQVIVVTKESQERFRQRYPNQPSEKFYLLYNGYDEENIQAAKINVPTRTDKKLQLIYIGTLPAKQNPQTFFEALAELASEIPLEPNLQIDFYGYARHEFQLLSQNLGLNGIIRFHGFVSRTESLSHLLSADAGLVNVPEGDIAKRILTGKIFEYIGTQKFVLALCPNDSALADLIAEGNLGISVPSQDKAAIKEAMKIMLEKHQTQQLKPQPPPGFLDRYERSAQTQALAKTFETALG